jgi:hypothetical protein
VATIYRRLSVYGAFGLLDDPRIRPDWASIRRDLGTRMALVPNAQWRALRAGDPIVRGMSRTCGIEKDRAPAAAQPCEGLAASCAARLTESSADAPKLALAVRALPHGKN